MLVVSKLKGGVSCIVFSLFLPSFVYILRMAAGWVKTPKSGIANGGVYFDNLCHSLFVTVFLFFFFGLRYSLDRVIPFVILHAGFE